MFNPKNISLQSVTVFLFVLLSWADTKNQRGISLQVNYRDLNDIFSSINSITWTGRNDLTTMNWRDPLKNSQPGSLLVHFLVFQLQIINDDLLGEGNVINWSKDCTHITPRSSRCVCLFICFKIDLMVFVFTRLDTDICYWDDKQDNPLVSCPTILMLIRLLKLTHWQYQDVMMGQNIIVCYLQSPLKRLMDGCLMLFLVKCFHIFY